MKADKNYQQNTIQVQEIEKPNSSNVVAITLPGRRDHSLHRKRWFMSRKERLYCRKPPNYRRRNYPLLKTDQYASRKSHLDHRKGYIPHRKGQKPNRKRWSMSRKKYYSAGRPLITQDEILFGKNGSSSLQDESWVSENPKFEALIFQCSQGLGFRYSDLEF